MPNFTVQQIAISDLKYVRKEGRNIDACALLKVVTNISRPAELKHLLVDLYRRCPAIEGSLSDRYFARKGFCQALTAKGAYCLLLALGGPSKEAVRQSCLADGRHLELNETESSNLFKEFIADNAASEETSASEEDSEPKVNNHARHTEKMKRCSSDLEALLLATQLQKQTRGVVDHYLQEQVDATIKRVTDLTSTVGTHDAAELLMTFGHTRQEATWMANSFGCFLKAASRGIYDPNKRKQHVSCSLHQVDANLFHPTAHTHIIQSAYESFKLSEITNTMWARNKKRSGSHADK